MKEELILLHYPDTNPNNWGVFTRGGGPDPYGFPSYLYRKYEVEENKTENLFDVLVNIRDKLVGLKILPNKENEEVIFPTQIEINNWNSDIQRIVYERIDGILK